MPRPTNSEIEQYYFDLFRSHYALPAGRIEYADKPDVILHGERRLGIEIANLYLADGSDPASEQVQRRRREQVLERAQSLHLASGGRRIELSAAFDPGVPILEIDPLARKLAEIAMRVQGSSGQVDSLTFDHVPELTFLYHSGKEYAGARWRSVQSYAVPFVSVERVRQLVVEKTAKVADYDKGCQAFWLLLVVDFMDPAQDQFIEWPDGVALAKSPFERILIYKPQFGQVVDAVQAAM
ncbi:hypothetical protein [Paraburkholderia pallida]|uniref:Uncharacterized protein n=1 Tax=Paraburkholderia pallida TaxID=2547399 RepID=A0A4V1B0W8_9BURK|nr:hypothetical protein [Paraburkholderia pallida]QBR04223.1 hypothetical protein E1956_44670 [Paraburkholderia pallida]